jgi:hypothetical protein
MNAVVMLRLEANLAKMPWWMVKNRVKQSKLKANALIMTRPHRIQGTS